MTIRVYYTKFPRPVRRHGKTAPWSGETSRLGPRRWSFQLRHAGAARCRTSLCLRTTQRRPLSPLLQPLQGAVVVVAVRRDYSASPRSGETSRLAVSDAGRIRPPAVSRLNSQTPRLPAAKAIPRSDGQLREKPRKTPIPRGLSLAPFLPDTRPSYAPPRFHRPSRFDGFM